MSVTEDNPEFYQSYMLSIMNKINVPLIFIQVRKT